MVYIALLVSAIIAGLDQLFKYLAIENLSDKTTVPLITVGGKDWLNLTFVENKGAGFSILEGQTLFLSIFTGVVIICAIVLLLSKKIKNPFAIWGISFVIGGGLGNLIDRIFRGGAVVDYIDVRIINFAIFNFADCFVVIGVIMIIISLLFSSNSEKREKSDAKE